MTFLKYMALGFLGMLAIVLLFLVIAVAGSGHGIPPFTH